MVDFNLSVKFTKVKIYDAALIAELNKSSGVLWKYVERKLKPLMLTEARQLVGVRSGRLRENIRWYHMGSFYGQSFGLRADLPYALLHHRGTRPHVINAKNPSGNLVFVNRNRVLVHTPSVNHPGTKPNPYLSRTLRHVRNM